MCAWQFAKAQHIAAAAGWTRFASMQNHDNLVCREEKREMIPPLRGSGHGSLSLGVRWRALLAGTREGSEPLCIRAGNDAVAPRVTRDRA